MISPAEVVKTAYQDGTLSESKERCQVCGSNSLKQIIDLGVQPICNALISSSDDFQNEPRYPLTLMICEDCQLVQLSEVPPSDVVFNKNFNYVSGSTKDIVEYFNDIAKSIIHDFNLKPGDLVVDIGSNDGTLLRAFKNRDMEVLGIEPAPIIAKMANESGIETINGRFEGSVQEFLKRLGGRAPKIILAFNVLAHTDTPDQFMHEVSRVAMESNSIFISQSHYLGNLVDKCEYDTIYHEHARYYSLNSLGALHKRHGMQIFDAKLVEFYGGSILAYATCKNYAPSKGMTIIENYERENLNEERLNNFAYEVLENRGKLLSILNKIKKDGKRVAGIGAPMKSSTLLNFCGITQDLVDFLTEVNPLKIGKFSPGSHLPIMDESKLLEEQPDYALILSWNVSKSIIEKIRGIGYRGKFIIPIPEPEVIS